MIVQREMITEALLDEVQDLLQMHHDEVGTLPQELDIDKLLYIKASARYMYAAYTLRRRGGKLVGYIGYHIHSHPHYLTNMATQDIFFIKPKYRRGLKGLKLLKFSEKDLDENFSIHYIMQQTTCSLDISPLFKRMGYEYAGSNYLKRL